MKYHMLLVIICGALLCFIYCATISYDDYECKFKLAHLLSEENDWTFKELYDNGFSKYPLFITRDEGKSIRHYFTDAENKLCRHDGLLQKILRR